MCSNLSLAVSNWKKNNNKKKKHCLHFPPLIKVCFKPKPSSEESQTSQECIFLVILATNPSLAENSPGEVCPWWKRSHRFQRTPAGALGHCSQSSEMCVPIAATLRDHTKSSLMFDFKKMYRQLTVWHYIVGFPDSSAGKESSCNAGDTGDTLWSLGREDPLEKDMVTHSSITLHRI